MIVVILILGFILRLISLNQSLWIDEATTMNVARNFNFGEIVTKFSPGDFHPPLYYLFMKVWVSSFGSSEIVGRLPSVIFGVATIYVVYLMGKKLINKEVGLVAGLLLATSGLHIYYSQEARMYLLVALLVSLSVYTFIFLIERGESIGKWFVLAVLIALIGATDYVALLILPVFWIVGIILKKDFTWFKKLLMSHIILVVFAFGWLPIFLRQFNSGLSVSPTSAWANVLGTFSVKEILLIPIKFVIGRVGFDNKIIYGFIVGMVSLLFGYLVFKSSEQLKKLKTVYLWLLVPIGLGIAISLKIPVLNYFRFLFVLPAFYLIIALGVNTLSQGKKKLFLGLVVVVNLVTSVMYLTNMKFQREDWRGMVQSLETSGQSLVFPTKSQREAVVYYGAEDKIIEPENLSKNVREIWLVRYAQAISDPEDKTRTKIENLGYTKHQELDFNGVVVWRYSLN